MTWTPAPLGQHDTRILLRVLTFCAIARGWDYLTPPGSPGPAEAGRPTLSTVEAAAPLWVWGLVFLIGGLVLAVGMLARCHRAVWGGLAWLSCCYVPLSVGIILGAASEPWFDGLRSGTVLILPATLSVMLALRTGPRAMTSEERQAVERIEAPTT